MRLATRLSLYFLGSLAVTLAGFGVALYLLVAGHLDRQMDQRLESAVAALTAAVEIKEDCVEWEPHQRRLDLPGVRWQARDPAGVVVGSSAEPIPEGITPGEPGQTRVARITDADGAAWRVLQVRIDPPRPRTSKRAGADEHGVYESLVLTTAAPLGPDDASLRWLAGTLAALAVGVWSAAALIGGRLCRRALAPVARMAASARAIPATGEQRLEVAATGDELEDLGRSFNGLLDRLREAFERQRRFTGEASHQLRTPLAVMLGQVEVALRRERPAEEYRRVLTVVGDQAGRLHRVVEMLLFLARADAEAALPSVGSLELRAWLGEHLKGWATHPRAADLRLDVPAAEVYGLAHSPLLGQAVDALLGNAFAYSQPGSAVTVSVREDAGQVLLTVEDGGCGIDADDLPRVFEPFYRSARQGGANASGVGLGLAIAHRVVEAMGGRITAQSEIGRGSRFVIRLAAPDALPPRVPPPTITLAS